ncbi:MAG TPA: KUP/HAK/KT family potassium transporter [bacterium]|nr:KUP/HAK/KT family potassium transporter [bacterium]
MESAIAVPSRQPAHPATPEVSPHHPRPTAGLALVALGVVFGDIGTSPLYALKECVSGAHGAAVTPANIFGVLSLIIWALLLIVAVKYVSFILRADHHGEGGILALLGLLRENAPAGKVGAGVSGLLIFGAALLYGDGIITPAVSVLSAVEGLQVMMPSLQPLVVPLTVAMLLALFLFQKRGTAGVARLFGPVMLVWFFVLGGLGVWHLLRQPAVLAALNPLHGLRFLATHGWHGFTVLGAVFLAVTGGEALYADIGHFGVRPVRRAWFWLVLPALLLNYFGQGALLLAKPAAAANPFYALVPAGPWTALLTLLATAATIIASQALITGAFSLTRQAVQLGLFPRVDIRHTSEDVEGQIYLPAVNWAVAVGAIALVLAFGSSSRLAAAYGIAVSGTMVITTVIYALVVRRVWHRSRAVSGLLAACFLAIDLPFLFANGSKFLDGGWVPLVLAVALYLIMTTWRDGRACLARGMAARILPRQVFIDDLKEHKTPRVAGTAVFMASFGDGIPPTLLHHFKHNKMLHRTVILLHVRNENLPYVPPQQRISAVHLGSGFHAVTARFGYMETPNVPRALRQAKSAGVPVELADISYYFGRETVLARGTAMPRWRARLFGLIVRNARSAVAYFRIAPERVVELGMPVEL